MPNFTSLPALALCLALLLSQENALPPAPAQTAGHDAQVSAPAAATAPAATPAPAAAPSPSAVPSPTAAPAPAYVPGKDKLYILMFHDVVEDGQACSNWAVTVSELRGYLQWLFDHRYTTVLPSQLARGEALPERAVMLTFDDGYTTNYLYAYPILQEYGAKAVISPVVGYMESEVPGYLTWDMCREMVDSGLVEIGSHTYDSHTLERCVSRLEGETQAEYEARVFSDVDKSVEIIRQRLGTQVEFFAYPNGRTDPWSDSFLAERFAVTVTTDYGPAALSQGLLQLPRYNINKAQPVSAVLPS